MTYLAPSWMLFGLAAVTIPVILHFFYRARYRPVEWGAMKFLRLSIEQTSRRLRFQEWLLLILRFLVCLLLAMALLRLTSCDAKEQRERGKTVDAIFIVDTSYSMAARELDEKGRPQTRLEIAKQNAIKIIDELPSDSTVRVITCSDKALYPDYQSPTNRDQAKRVIENIAITHQKTELSKGFAKAESLLAESKGDTKEVYLFSDMQRLGWERQSTAIRMSCEAIRQKASFYPIRCGSKPIKNVTITNIIPQVDLPTTEMRIPFTVVLHNSGAGELTDLKLTTVVDGVPLEKDSITIPPLKPGETRPFTVTSKLDKPGWHLITASVGPDDLDVDNRLDLSIFVREKVRILVVDGAPTDSGVPSKAGSFYLANAIAPVPADQIDMYLFQRKIIRAVDAIPESLNDSDLCILVDVPFAGVSAPPTEFLNALKDYVRAGNALMMTAGDNMVASRKEYNQEFGDLLPLELADRVPTAAPANDPFTPDLTSIDDSSFLAKFKQPNDKIGDLIAKADTIRILPVTEAVGNDRGSTGRVLMRFSNGEPLLAVRQVGQGKVFLLTTSVFRSSDPAEAWSYLAINPALPAIVDAFVKNLVERSSANLNLIAGKEMEWSPPNPDTNYYLLKPPDQAEQRLADRFIPLGRPNPTDKLFHIDDTSISGIYRVGTEEYRDRMLEREKSGAPLEESANASLTFSVLPDLTESESLESMTDEQIDQLLGFAPVRKADVPEWTIWFLIAVLGFALGETAWAWYCGRAW